MHPDCRGELEPVPIPAHLHDRFARLLRRTQAVYGLVSRRPAILHVALYAGTLGEMLDSFERVFEATRGRPLYLLCSHGSLDEWLLPGWLELAPELAQRFPHVHCYHLCNQLEAVASWQAQGLQAIHCNQNSFVDEAVYYPLELPGPKAFRAVYDARLLPFKRHWLAERVDQLALIHYTCPSLADVHYVEQLQHRFERAHFFNDESGGYRRLEPCEVNHCLNRCGVGLCLSEAEGAMYASAQYLLSGLAVVTTPSRGGRDDFFDEHYALTVEPDPQAVADGVGQMLQRNLDPWEIHRATLELMMPHRRRFLELVQSLYDRHHAGRSFAAEWPGLFFNRFLANQSHHETIAWLS